MCYTLFLVHLVLSPDIQSWSSFVAAARQCETPGSDLSLQRVHISESHSGARRLVYVARGFSAASIGDFAGERASKPV